MRNFHLPGRSPVYSQNGMVATSHPVAAQVALSALKKGGNAVDAALAAALVLPICEPQMTGLFGDMFALVKPSGTDKIVGLNSSGRSPKRLNSEILRDKGFLRIDANSHHSVTLPGAVIGFEKLANDYGKLGLSEACEPAIYYAEKGVPVSPRVAFDWEKNAHLLSHIAQKFYLIDGRIPKSGEVFRAPQQAKVLRKIQKAGANDFYSGEIAEDFVSSLSNLGGLHTMDDLASVSCDYVEPISAFYGNLELVELPPNGQGATALLLAKIMSNFDLANLSETEAQRIHWEAEAVKLAHKARNELISDPDSLNLPVQELFSDNLASELAASIKSDRASPNLPASTEEFHLDTVLITVVDKDQCAVSLIFSIFHSFGSGHSSEKFGLLFQNRGAAFTLKKNHPNELQGYKRPLHTIIPAMVKKDGRVHLSYGVMGGQYQPTGHVRILSNLQDYKMDLQEAIDYPRSFADTSGLLLEDGYSESVEKQLQNLGHEIIRPISPLGGAQAIELNYDNGVLIGASDARKDGLAIGY